MSTQADTKSWGQIAFDDPDRRHRHRRSVEAVDEDDNLVERADGVIRVPVTGNRGHALQQLLEQIAPLVLLGRRSRAQAS